MNSRDKSIQQIVTTGLMAAVVFAATCLSFPNGVGGYTHLGDAMVVLAVMFLGGKRGAAAAGIGAMLADIILGYAVWAPFSLVSKIFMVIVIAAVMNHSFLGFSGRPRWVAAVILGVIAETLIYSCAGFILEGGIGGAVAEAVGMAVQGGLALIVGLLLSEAFQKSPLKSLMIYRTDDTGIKKAAEN
jgi:uncharacterized membrane protein